MMKKANKITLLVLTLICVTALIFSLFDINWSVFNEGPRKIFNELREVIVLIGLIFLFIYHYLSLKKDINE